jgi:hypothetical protein
MTLNYRKNCNENEDLDALNKVTFGDSINTRFTQYFQEKNSRKNSREEILKQVEKCILNDRQNTYGTPEDNFQVIADLWNIYLGIKDEDLQLTRQDVAIMMMLLKVARMKSSPNHLDNYVDAAGYSVIAGSFCEKEGEK